MVNRLNDPDLQFCDATGAPYAGGFLYFYATGTSTPLATYNDPDLAAPHANSNPIELDSAGRAGAVFLQELAYKVVLKDSSLNTIWTMDPVSTDFTPKARFLTYAGNPNGNVAGTAGSASTNADSVWDRTNNALYVCTTTGVAASAVWTLASTLGGSIAFSGDVTPAQITSTQNNYNPTGLSTASVLRLSSDAVRSITGIAGGADGRILILMNVGSFAINLVDESASTASDAANRFNFSNTNGNQGTSITPRDSVTIIYDSTVSRWKMFAVGTPVAGQGDMESPQTLGTGYVTPFFTQYHPGVAKFTAYVTVNAGTPTLAASYNVTSITDTGTGLLTITIATDFAGVNWMPQVTVERAATALTVADLRYAAVRNAGQAAGTLLVECWDGTAVTANQVDPAAWSVVGFGDQ